MTVSELAVTVANYVATIEICRPPSNFFDQELIAALADQFEAVDDDRDSRVIVLGARGKAFCAGSDFSKRSDQAQGPSEGSHGHIYKEALRLFRTRKPIIAAVHGSAIGGGLGLALVADFRVTCEEARFSANFNRLGIHPGFGLTFTLPALVGAQEAARLFYTGRRISGGEAVRIGLADGLVPQDQVLSSARELAIEIAQSAPLAVQSTRETLRRGRVEAVAAATEREIVEQDWLRRTSDFREGCKAMAERRLPEFRAE